MATLNLAHGRGLSPNQVGLPQEAFEANIDAAVAVIKRETPDVLALQEADAPSAWSGSFDHVRRLATAANYPHVHHGLHVSAGLRSLKLQYGTALLAHRPLKKPASYSFKQNAVNTKGFVTAEIEFDSRPLIVVSVHLHSALRSIRLRQVDKLVSVLAAAGNPIVLMGDLNSRWEHESDAVRVLASRLNLKAYQPERAGMATYRANAPGKRIDWVLISPQLEFVGYRVWPDQVSDHLGVEAEIRWRTSAVPAGDDGAETAPGNSLLTATEVASVG